MGTDTRGEDKRKIRIEQHAFMGSVWCRMALHHRLSPPDVLERGFCDCGLALLSRRALQFTESAGYPERNKAPVGVKL